MDGGVNENQDEVLKHVQDNVANNVKNTSFLNTSKPDHEIIHTPSFSLAETPQPRIITQENQDLSAYLPLHQPLEILERRIRGDYHRYECPTESVAELYMIIPDFEPNPDELAYGFTYSLPRDENRVPTFWERRAYDLDSELLDDKESEELEKEVEEKMKIVYVQKMRRTDWREQKRLLRIVQENEEKQAELEAESRKSNSFWIDPLPPDQRKKKKQENSTLRIQWSIGAVLTDSTDVETDPDDFIL
ncbi:hypothetical protein TVAG_454370 [Trichomonas vaginalis G3]|uniref:Uncharacterized protein n=1 Tax=Trichomonas vaginalis (strain ATCC PRA-98 / G3) TaxID=412133 RepID=A2EU50_TRIV3|nr:hypothetical protein TVAGG3_0231000 [Trichomonas vaginalis G3]EAY03798.1 hypothetical protein TVAG_454370 [Trichomonas vaginalis G3]KAI5552627.1 hypothetical protein TVAGG3_0231000 [Trichomonas vaginalis G3]|eukprot:XP_001316021.1 hypothetical protein [Trichomonas vaginalis G3]